MLQFLKDRTCSAVPVLNSITKGTPIGVDMGGDALTMAQLVNNGQGINLIAGGYENRPENIRPGSVEWQRWAIDTIQKLCGRGQFRGRDVIAAIPPADLFIDHIKMPRTDAKSKTKEAKETVDNAVIAKIKQKLPFESGNAMIRYIPAEEDNALVIAAERKIIDRHLAIYERTGLVIKAMGVWPIAMARSYTKFFGRRQADIETVVVLELNACKRHFASMYRKAQIERLVFLSGRAVEKDLCVTIAKQLEMPAQMGDCLAAVQVAGPSESGVDRRNCQVHWAVAFGLSLL
jgi:Tfp pilus assembly PilM family ATPase